MPALVKSLVLLPRFVPHNNADAGAETGAGPFSSPISKKPPFTQPALTRTHSPVRSLETSFQPQGSEAGESSARLAHDARNVLSGLMLYCELLAAPGVLNPPHGHYAEELEGIAQTAAQILEKIIEVAAPPQAPAPRLRKTSEAPSLPTAAVPLTAVPVTDVAAELRRLQPLLAAIAGPAVKLSIASMPCAGEMALAVEDFTRIMVNLVRNAADAMPAGGHIGMTAQYGDGLSFDANWRPNPDRSSTLAFPPAPRSVLLSVSDDGPGIPEPLRARIFDPGFTTHQEPEAAHWPAPRRRGLGLSIVRNLVESAGGAVRATASHSGGARFEITLPLRETVTSGTCLVQCIDTFPADSREKGCIECE